MPKPSLTFDLVLREGFKTPVTITVECHVGAGSGRVRQGLWWIVKKHWHLYRLIADWYGGTLYGVYWTTVQIPYLVCYNDYYEHNVTNVDDPQVGFVMRAAPLDGTRTWNHLTSGRLIVLNPRNTSMRDFNGRWSRWIV